MYKLLSHNDLDGIGCGILAKLAFGDKVNVRYNSVSSLDYEVAKFLESEDKQTFLFITDLSVNEDNEIKLQDFYQHDGKVQLIDHHKTAISLNEYDWATVTVESEDGKQTAATSLFYQYLLDKELLEPSDAIEEFVELVRQYDTWEWDANNNLQAKQLNTLFFLGSIDDFEEKMIERLGTSDHFSFDEFEQKILAMEEDKMERYIRRKRRELVQTNLDGHYAGVVYAESYHSELGNELGKEYPHLDYIVILNIGGRRMGFRTIHDHVDVSKIAGKYGGGGHEKASGAILTDAAYKHFVEKTFKLDPLKEDAKRNRFNVKQSSFGTYYRDRTDNYFLIIQENNYKWIIEKNQKKMDQGYASFEEAEIFIKRKFQAWLDRDEGFVNYLINEVNKAKKK